MRRIIVAVALASTAFAGGAWDIQTPLPRGVAGHAAVATADGTLWVVGGSFWQSDAKRIDATVHRLRRGGEQWEAAFELPRGFAHGGAAGEGGTLWLAGGFDARGPSAATHRVDLVNATVSRSTPLPEPRAYCGAAYLDGGIWIIGGTGRDGEFANLPTSWFRLDATSGQLRTMPTSAPATINPVVLALNGELHVLPGSVWSAKHQRLEAPTDVWIYALNTQRWTRRPLAQPLPRGLSGVAIDVRRALLVGGVRSGTSEFSRAAWIYDALENTLVPLAPLPEPRLAAAAVTAPDSWWVIGGEDRARSRAATVWRLRLPAATAR